MAEVSLDVFGMGAFGDEKRCTGVSEVVHSKAIGQPCCADGRLPDAASEIAVPKWLTGLRVVGPVAGMTADELKGGDPEPVGEIVMRHGGGGWLPNGFEPASTFERAGGHVIVGGGYAVMGLVGPASMGGIEYELQSVMYCIFGASATDYVSAVFVSVGRTAEDDHVAKDFTKRTTDGCYTIPVCASGRAFSLAVRAEGSELRAGDVETAWVPVGEPMSS